MPFANLPWYDFEEITHATDSLWQHLAENLRRYGLENVPETLNRQVPYEQQWDSEDFLFGQACGYDVLLSHCHALQIVATPHYLATGCQGNTHQSFVIVRIDSHFHCLEDLRGTVCVINGPTSHSGMNALRSLIAPINTDGRFFSHVIVSGAHERSLRMIVDGPAHVAAIDCITYAFLKQFRPALVSDTRMLYKTPQVPSPPFVTSALMSPDKLDRMRKALVRTLEDPALEKVRRDLLLDHIDILPIEAYQPIADLEGIAREHCYYEIPSGLPF